MTSRRPPMAMTVIAVRLGAGIVLGAKPAAFLSNEPAIEGTSMPLLLRTVGIRDLALGLGAAAALRSGSRADLKRWLVAGLVSDSLDVVAGCAAIPSSGWRGALSAAVALPMLPLDVKALRLLAVGES